MGHCAQRDQLEQHQLLSCSGYKDWNKVVEGANADVVQLGTSVTNSYDNDNPETGMEDEQAYCCLGDSLPSEDEGGDDGGHDDGVDQGEGNQLQG